MISDSPCFPAALQSEPRPDIRPMLSLRPLAIVLPLAAALRDPKKLSFVPSEDLLAEPGTETETPGAGDAGT